MENGDEVDCGRWLDMLTILGRPSAFGSETGRLPIGVFEPGKQNLEALKTAPILVIGAGGLGSEILKDLALSGFCNIHVVDMDTIDMSNLNRQFLFRQKDVGKAKAKVAADFINSRVAGCNVVPYTERIQSYDKGFYSQFRLIIAGLDNVDARRWMNSLLVSMVDYDQDGIIPETVIPFIDGGVEGFKGQARVILPAITSCFECTIDLFPPQKSYPLCTIAETPRLPEHCITYITLIVWPKEFPDKKMDTDDPADMQWVYEAALKRAETYGIPGVTYFKTIGVVKNIIPAVASTNAIIAAACVNEALKILTFASQSLNTYLMYMGDDGLYCNTFECAKSSTCLVCGPLPPLIVSVPSTTTVSELFQKLIEEHQLYEVSLGGNNGQVYMRNPPSLEIMFRVNLTKPLSEFFGSGDMAIVTSSGRIVKMKLFFQ